MPSSINRLIYVHHAHFVVGLCLTSGQQRERERDFDFDFDNALAFGPLALQPLPISYRAGLAHGQVGGQLATERPIEAVQFNRSFCAWPIAFLPIVSWNILCLSGNRCWL